MYANNCEEMSVKQYEEITINANVIVTPIIIEL